MAGRPETRDRVLLGLAIAVVLGGHLAWNLADEVPLTPDAYGYLAKMLRFHDGFPWSDGGALTAIGELGHGGRPPLYQLATLPFMWLFGRTEDAFLLVNLPLIALLMLATYALARAAYGRGAGPLAAVFVACYPPLVHLPRGYLPHLGAVAFAAVALWLLVGLCGHRSPRRAVAFGVCLGVGMLFHPSFFWALAAPTVVFGLVLLLGGGEPARPAGWRELPRWLGSRLRTPLAVRGLLPAALAAAVLAVPWYATVGDKLIRLQQRLLSPELAAIRGYRYRTVGFPDVDPSPAWYTLTAPGALSRSAVLLLVAGAAFCLWRRRGPATAVLLVTLAGSLLALSLQSTLAWLYPPPALPAAAALAAGGICATRRRAVRRTVAAAGVLTAAIAFVHVSWGAPPPLDAVAELDGASAPARVRCRFQRIYCSSPPTTGRWPTDEVLATVFADPRCQREPPCSLLVVYGAQMGKTLFEFRRTLSWPQRELIVRSQLRAEWGSPFPYRALLTSDYLFYADLRPRPGERKSYMAALQELLRSPPERFARSHETALEVELPQGVRGRLLRRTAPLTAAEAQEVVEALDVPPHVTGEGLDFLARLLAREGDREAVLEVLRRAEEAGVGQRYLRRIAGVAGRGGAVVRPTDGGGGGSG